MMTLTPRCPSMLDKLKALAAGLNEYYQARIAPALPKPSSKKMISS